MGLLFIRLTQTGLGYCQPLQPISRRRDCERITGELGPTTCTLWNRKTLEKPKFSFNKRQKHETKRLLPMMPCFVNGALLLFSLNGLHFTLPCILATAISASFQSGINHCGESVWEICAVGSVPRMFPFLCLVVFPRTSSIYINAQTVLCRCTVCPLTSVLCHTDTFYSAIK